MNYSFVLDGKEVSLFMDYERLLLVEERLGRGIMAIASELARGDLPMRSMVELITVCMLCELQIQDLGERLMRYGISRLSDVLACFLCGVLAGEVFSQGLSGDSNLKDVAEMMARFPDC